MNFIQPFRRILKLKHVSLLLRIPIKDQLFLRFLFTKLYMTSEKVIHHIEIYIHSLLNLHNITNHPLPSSFCQYIVIKKYMRWKKCPKSTGVKDENTLSSLFFRSEFRIYLWKTKCNFPPHSGFFTRLIIIKVKVYGFEMKMNVMVGNYKTGEIGSS